MTKKGRTLIKSTTKKTKKER